MNFGGRMLEIVIKLSVPDFKRQAAALFAKDTKIMSIWTLGAE
jgi:hypothetical protein